MTGRSTKDELATSGGVGSSPQRPDGVLKARGEFAYSSDLWHEDMIWGATLRSPHPYARILRVDLTGALKVPGVYAVLTHADVPGTNLYGLEHSDQPVLAVDVVRYQGEPIALVGADHPETARRALARIVVDYEVLTPVTDAQAAARGAGPTLHPGGNVVRHVPVRHGDVAAARASAEIVVTGEYQVGMQDQAFLGPESGLAVPAEDGGVDLFVATQWLHVDQRQVAIALGLPSEKVRLTLAGVGGAYASSTGAVVANAATLGVGPYNVPNASIDCWGVYTNNPPCGAMRGFGAVQAGFAYESQMDKLAVAVGVDPVEIRVRNAMSEGGVLPTGQVIDSAAPVARLLELVRDKPMPPESDTVDIRLLPGGVSNTTHGEGVVRGVGYAVGIKNICFSEGFDDYSTARLRLEVVGDEPSVMVHTAAAEVGQGLVTIQQQIVRTELGVRHVVIHPTDTSVGNGGSSSASRQTYVTGGAVKAACEAVRSRVLTIAAHRYGVARRDLALVGGKVVAEREGVLADLVDVLGDEVVEQTVEWRHRPTEPLDPVTGQGRAHVQYGFAAHRAVVDVDVELGLVRVVELSCAQDVGKAMNPRAVLGQIHGGSAQGLGLAVMEEIQIAEGRIRNPSFTDYLIPTILDMPPMTVDVLELADPHAPYGLRGVGEPPTISSTPAIVAAIRAATGLALTRAPVRPEHITGL